MGEWIWQEGGCGEASCSRREGSVCFALLFASHLNFCSSCICQTAIFGASAKPMRRGNGQGCYQDNSLPRGRMLLSQDSNGFSLTKNISSWDITACFFSSGVLVVFCLIWSCSSCSVAVVHWKDSPTPASKSHEATCPNSIKIGSKIIWFKVSSCIYLSWVWACFFYMQQVFLQKRKRSY